MSCNTFQTLTRKVNQPLPVALPTSLFLSPVVHPRSFSHIYRNGGAMLWCYAVSRQLLTIIVNNNINSNNNNNTLIRKFAGVGQFGSSFSLLKKYPCFLTLSLFLLCVCHVGVWLNLIMINLVSFGTYTSENGCGEAPGALGPCHRMWHAGGGGQVTQRRRVVLV